MEYFIFMTEIIKKDMKKPIYIEEFIDEVVKELESRFHLSYKEIQNILDWHAQDIESAFFEVKDSIDAKPLVDYFVFKLKLNEKLKQSNMKKQEKERRVIEIGGNLQSVLIIVAIAAAVTLMVIFGS